MGEKQMNFISQSGEDEYPFEFHVTVIDADKHDFKMACMVLGVRPITIDLQDHDGKTVFHDVMTSSRFKGTTDEAYVEMLRISDGLHDKGFHVVRKKMETVPFHPMAPSNSNGIKIGDGQYFETHIEIVMGHDQERDDLVKITNVSHVHLSANIFKKYGNVATIMVTLRRTDLKSEDFKDEVDKLEDIIINSGFSIKQTINEFAIYDSRIKHDEDWING